MLSFLYSKIFSSKKKTFLFVLFVIIILIIFIWWQLSRIKAVGYEVEKQDAIKGVTVSGTVESRHDVKLTTRITAKIMEIRFQEGDFVKQGQVLAILGKNEILGNLVTSKGQLSTAKAEVRNLQTEPRVQQVAIASAQVNESQKNIDVLQKELQGVKVQLQEALSEEKRLEKLYKQGAVSFRDFERAGFARVQTEEQIGSFENQIQAANSRLVQAKQNLNLIQSGVKIEQIQAAQGQIEAAQGGVQSALGKLEDYTVKAPVTGYIVEKILDKGEVVSSSSPLLRLVTPDALYISTEVEENELQNVKTAQDAYIIFDAYPAETFLGKVTQVSKNVNPITGTFEAKVTVPLKKGMPIIVGMTADVTIIIQQIKDAIIIPNEFVNTINQKKYVLKKSDNKAVKVFVEGMDFDNNRFKVTKGLKKGDIIVKGIESKKVNPDDRIKIVENYRD